MNIFSFSVIWTQFYNYPSLLLDGENMFFFVMILFICKIGMLIYSYVYEKRFLNDFWC